MKTVFFFIASVTFFSENYKDWFSSSTIAAVNFNNKTTVSGCVV